MTNALFGAVKLTKNVDIDKYKYSEYRIGFDGHGFYSYPSGGTGWSVIIFRVDMSLSSKTDNKGKDILILGKGPTQGLVSTHYLLRKCIRSVLLKLTQNFVWACIIMEQTVTCLLMVQKFIDLKQKILKLFQIICA